MQQVQAILVAYVFSRWNCTFCGIFERGTEHSAAAPTNCPQCGRSAAFENAIPGMTSQPLPFHTKPRRERENDGKYYPRGGNKANGKSTGRPRKQKP